MPNSIHKYRVLKTLCKNLNLTNSGYKIIIFAQKRVTAYAHIKISKYIRNKTMKTFKEIAQTLEEKYRVSGIDNASFVVHSLTSSEVLAISVTLNACGYNNQPVLIALGEYRLELL